MKRKINLHFLVMAFLAILLTLVISAAVSYEVLKNEVMEELQTCSSIMQATGAFSDMDHITYDAKEEGLRVTVVAKDGTVKYDSDADVLDMENHESRPEVEEAFAQGEGKAIRKSETLNQSMFYYATLLENGCVLRTAKKADNIWTILSSSFPMLLGLAAVLAAFGALLSHFLTKSIVAPIEQMANDMDHLESVCVYKELRPFITTIQKQHEDIRKNADMRQEFTANVSHELKTPLTSISGYSELIESGMATDEDVTRFAGEIHQNANRLLTLINDIIRLSELDVSTEEIPYEQLDLYAIAEKCVDMLQVNAENHGVTIRLTGKNAYIHANREMINELLYNLCDNAIRYNKKGGTVDVSVEEEEGQVILSVKDTGIGISKEHQERIFERFYRVDRSRSKLTGGTGLGLAIVKHIVAQHNAKLELESEKDVGTQIRILFLK